MASLRFSSQEMQSGGFIRSIRKFATVGSSPSQEASRKLDGLLGSCLLERLPVITPENKDWELEYNQHQQALYEKYCRDLPSEFNESDAIKAEAAAEAWQPAPCITEADLSNDHRSLQRKLSRRLFFLVKPQGSKEPWDLPKAHYKMGETTRQTAERALGRATEGLASNIFFIGHAPCAHYGFSGGDCFIHKAQLIDGIIHLAEDSGYEDFAWLCREEVLERIEPDTHELFTQLLPTSP